MKTISTVEEIQALETAYHSILDFLKTLTPPKVWEEYLFWDEESSPSDMRQTFLDNLPLARFNLAKMCALSSSGLSAEEKVHEITVEEDVDVIRCEMYAEYIMCLTQLVNSQLLDRSDAVDIAEEVQELTTLQLWRELYGLRSLNRVRRDTL